mmetsp:Transcript_23261/g.58830  ORF Transcript_23261/g.58830 Transcript_23261/m.58830 type:complete len:286 (+) Transcript_23261:807-1664(+)
MPRPLSQVSLARPAAVICALLPIGFAGATPRTGSVRVPAASAPAEEDAAPRRGVLSTRGVFFQHDAREQGIYSLMYSSEWRLLVLDHVPRSCPLSSPRPTRCLRLPLLDLRQPQRGPAPDDRIRTRTQHRPGSVFRTPPPPRRLALLLPPPLLLLLLPPHQDSSSDSFSFSRDDDVVVILEGLILLLADVVDADVVQFCWSPRMMCWSSQHCQNSRPPRRPPRRRRSPHHQLLLFFPRPPGAAFPVCESFRSLCSAPARTPDLLLLLGQYAQLCLALSLSRRPRG